MDFSDCPRNWRTLIVHLINTLVNGMLNWVLFLYADGFNFVVAFVVSRSVLYHCSVPETQSRSAVQVIVCCIKVDDMSSVTFVIVVLVTVVCVNKWV